MYKRAGDASVHEKRKPLTEHEEKQQAILKNMKRLRAERLEREANRENPEKPR